jgi:HAD superfamily hydrolase (TIGR01509 family)
MDGVIVDSESEWKALEAEFFRAAVPAWRAEHHEKIVGMGVEDVYKFLVSEFDLTMGKSEFLQRSDDVAKKVYETRVELAVGFIPLALELKHRGIRTAIASSSPSRWIALVINRFHLSPLLDEIVSADDVGGRTKPLPDIYLEAASRLQIPTPDCVAIEDSSIGLLAAKRAGLRTAAFRTAHNAAQDLSAAEFEISGFDGLDYNRLMARLKSAS